MSNQIVQGSLGAVARKSNQSLAFSFMSVTCLVMVDVSASMAETDAGNGLSRFEAANEQLRRLQNENAGEIAVCAFSNRAEFCPSGVPVFQRGMTDLCAALDMLKMADGCGIKLVLISDGEPNDEEAALKAAAKFTSKIDTIFVGDETGSGREFLRKLSAATGGVSIVNKTENLNLLSENITRLIGA
jgi:Mg-chelatase subunit ChlD